MEKKILSQKEFEEKYNELISQGYSSDSPEVIAIFEARARATRPRQRSQSRQNLQNQNIVNPTNSTRTYNKKKRISKSDLRAHIIINPMTGEYYLLDKSLTLTDYICSNPIKDFLKKIFNLNLKQFKKQLKSDYALYKHNCKKYKQPINPYFTDMYRKMKYYLMICPDADYNILELIRKNISKINPYYENYQTACAEYLHELANLDKGNPINMPFDINYATDDEVCSNHKYISNYFGKSKDPVNAFRKTYLQNRNTEFLNAIRTENTYVPKTKFEKSRIVKEKPYTR